ncbi:CPBP family intramembrane glutamic endopeptidase [Massilia phyllosphaerae]|uniref:CPBP family intramembrane glutamic endopeptidase n=1 Tax=Massilia phyllosphaerae TaxID=3106034 RepID=UPI002B1CE121|nr:CPBP family intramembrane glutamic endopeptidase [Massilia sp. SGZ-792]
MTPDPSILLTFGLLALTVLLLWVPAPAIRGRRDWAWCPGLALACVAGLAGGLLDWRAPLWILAYAALAIGARVASRAWIRVPLLVLTGVAAFLFALHRFPGFYNPVLAEGIRFSADTPAFSLRANADTAVAGIVLMGVFCERISRLADWRAMLRQVWPVVLSTLVVVLGLGWALGYVRPDWKWTPYSAWFLASNLLFTCVTEEAFFRGFILERLARGMARWRYGVLFATVLSSLLFGLAHARGGPLLVALATLAGVHYAVAYLRSRRIEGAILTHFALNAVHFVAFSYPYLTP